MTRRQKKYVLVVIAVVAAIIIASLLLGSASIPVDVYSKPTPPDGTDPYTVLPLTVCGMACIGVENETGPSYNSSKAFYDGGIVIEVTRFLYESSASSYVSSAYIYYDSITGSITYYDVGSKHWLAYTGPGLSVFVWQKDTWTFVVAAGDRDTRDAAAGELPY